LQKPPRICLQKPIEEVFQENVNDQCHRGDREDNLWVTINDYKPPEIQTEWEQTCFLDKSFHGYYKWPKLIKYSMNKRARYIVDDMPEQVAIIYDRFMDEKFLMQFIQFMVLDEHKGQINFDRIRFKMFKVKSHNNQIKRKAVSFIYLGSLSQFWLRVCRKIFPSIVHAHS